MAASQLALAKAQRVPSTHMVEKVPAFLAKLNEYVPLDIVWLTHNLIAFVEWLMTPKLTT